MGHDHYDDEVGPIVCKVKIFLHGEAKMPLLSATIRAGDCQCIWLACCCIFCMLAYVGFPSHGVS